MWKLAHVPWFNALPNWGKLKLRLTAVAFVRAGARDKASRNNHQIFKTISVLVGSSKQNKTKNTLWRLIERMFRKIVSRTVLHSRSCEAQTKGEHVPAGQNLATLSERRGTKATAPATLSNHRQACFVRPAKCYGKNTHAAAGSSQTFHPHPRLTQLATVKMCATFVKNYRRHHHFACRVRGKCETGRAGWERTAGQLLLALCRVIEVRTAWQ